MKKLSILLVTGLAMISISCTENQKVRDLGGNMTIQLPKGQKVTMATWKDLNLFYMLEPMEEGYIPKTKSFVENSNWGMMQSKVTFIESK